MVTDLVSVINSRLHIIGMGGIGKTSAVLAILNDERVAAHFDKNRHWVPCVEATSISLLLDLLATSLGISKGSVNPLADVVAFLRASKDRRVIVFDNFETPWDLDSKSDEAETILRTVASIKSVSIIITMRADKPPSGINWTRVNTPTLPPLHEEDARSVFLKLSPETTLGKTLDRLLAAIDYVPLAITLMANLSLYGETPGELLKRWNDK